MLQFLLNSPNLREDSSWRNREPLCNPMLNTFSTAVSTAVLMLPVFCNLTRLQCTHMQPGSGSGGSTSCGGGHTKNIQGLIQAQIDIG